MLDAIGRFITEIAEHLASLDEADLPGTVICLIMTDGYENASQERVRSAAERASRLSAPAMIALVWWSHT